MKSLASILMLALVFAVPASAQDATQDGYSADGPQAIEQTGDGGSSSNGSSGSGSSGNGSSGNASSADGSSELPFTGVDLVLIAGLGVGLLGVGLGMRRLTGPAGSKPASH